MAISANASILNLNKLFISILFFLLRQRLPGTRLSVVRTDTAKVGYAGWAAQSV